MKLGLNKAGTRLVLAAAAAALGATTLAAQPAQALTRHNLMLFVRNPSGVSVIVQTFRFGAHGICVNVTPRTWSNTNLPVWSEAGQQVGIAVFDGRNCGGRRLQTTPIMNVPSVPTTNWWLTI